MILHYSAAGVPIGWSLTAIYRDKYGIARFAADGWRSKGDAQALVEIDGEHIRRTELFWPAGFDPGTRQEPSDRLFFQHFADQYHQTEPVLALAEQGIRQMLVNAGYLIPREQWRARYPAQALISDRFAAFRAACDEARADGREVSFEPRWAPFMDVPDGWTPPYDVSACPEGYRIDVRNPFTTDPSNGFTWALHSEAMDAARLLNSGWTWDETRILLTEEPTAHPE